MTKKSTKIKKAPKTMPMEGLFRLKKYYSEELRRKDKIIDELKNQNELLIKTALKQSRKYMDISEYIKKMRQNKHK